MNKNMIYDIYVICMIIVLMFAIFTYFGCQVERICMVNLDGNQIGEIDCNIVRETGAYTLKHIQDYACSEKVINKVREKFGFGEIKECAYYCCVTDGTCSGFPPRGINIQMLSLKTEGD